MKLNRKWLNEEFVDLSGVPDREFVELIPIQEHLHLIIKIQLLKIRKHIMGDVAALTKSGRGSGTSVKNTNKIGEGCFN